MPLSAPPGGGPGTANVDPMKGQTFYHEGILEALRTSLSQVNNISSTSHRGSQSSSAGPATFGAHRSSAASLNEELRKNIAAESYLDYAAAAAAAMAAANANASKAAVSGSREKLDGGLPPPPLPSKGQQPGGQGGDQGP